MSNDPLEQELERVIASIADWERKRDQARKILDDCLYQLTLQEGYRQGIQKAIALRSTDESVP